MFFHVDVEPAARIDQFLHPEEYIKKNQPTTTTTTNPSTTTTIVHPELELAQIAKHKLTVLNRGQNAINVASGGVPGEDSDI